MGADHHAGVRRFVAPGLLAVGIGKLYLAGAVPGGAALTNTLQTGATAGGTVQTIVTACAVVGRHGFAAIVLFVAGRGLTLGIVQGNFAVTVAGPGAHTFPGPADFIHGTELKIVTGTVFVKGPEFALVSIFVAKRLLAVGVIRHHGTKAVSLYATDALAFVAQIALGAELTVIAHGAIGTVGIFALTGLRHALAYVVTLIKGRTLFGIAAHAVASKADIHLGAGIGIVAGCPVFLAGVAAHTGNRAAFSHFVTLVHGNTDHGIAAGAFIILAGIGLGAGIAVIAGSAVGLVYAVAAKSLATDAFAAFAGATLVNGKTTITAVVHDIAGAGHANICHAAEIAIAGGVVKAFLALVSHGGQGGTASAHGNKQHGAQKA